ncbi:hypothetical protein FQN49_000498 [Arthroderma sp. PD_2]|nr:hypothetical protein FQN49_000498 [Arthroderma sp. PD_2]
MGAPSLLLMSRRMCVKVVREITDVGLARYDVIRPILQKIENPQQLHELEQRSPHLLDHDDELWIEFIKRDIYFWEELDLSETPKSWYTFYISLREQADKKVDEDAERMRRALQGLDKEKSKHTPKIVDAKKMRLPQEKPTSVQRYAHHDRIMGGITPVFALNTKASDSSSCKPWEDNSRWKFIPPKLSSRPGSGPSGGRRSTLPPAVKRNSKLSTPTHMLNSMASRVIKAPKSLIEDRRPVVPSARSVWPTVRANNTTPTSTQSSTANPRTVEKAPSSTTRRAPTAPSIFLPPKSRVTRTVEAPKPNPTPTATTTRTSSQTQRRGSSATSSGRTAPNRDNRYPARSQNGGTTSTQPTSAKKRQTEHSPSSTSFDAKQKRLKVR